MTDPKFSATKQHLQAVLEKDSYLSYRAGQDEVTKAASILPATFGDKLKAYINIVNFFERVSLKS